MNTDCNPVVVAARGLGKRVQGPQGALQILNDIDLAIRRSEAVAILGPSGSGKSTLLGLLAGLDQATSGDAELFQHALRGLDEDARASLRAGRVGFVFQSFQLLPGMTALENVMLPLELSAHPNPHDAALDTLGAVGLQERENHYPNQLSGGEQQRVAIARAFAPQPQVLFADEPTGNLDRATGGHVIDLLFRLRADSGAALVLVTHDSALATRCDRCLFLDAGELQANE